MARERVEDLGRISVMMKGAFELEIFDLYGGRNKDFPDYFSRLSDDDKDNLLRKIIYGIQELKEKICDISDIADGCDILNIDSSCH